MIEWEAMSREICVDVTVSGLVDARKAVTLRAFVDNGSTDSALPAALLKRIGVQPKGSERYELWGNRTVRRRYGFAWFKIGKRTGACKVTFESPHEVPTVGATALEALGFDIDMKNGGLRTYIPRGPTLRRRPHHPLPKASRPRPRRPA